MRALSLNEEATIYRYALLGGFVQPAEVVAWADAWITRLEELPDVLVEVSLGGSRWNEMLSALGELGDAHLSCESSAQFCRLLLDFLRAHPDSFRAVTRLLEHLAIERALPEELMGEAARLDDALSLAAEGVFDLSDVRREILDFLVQYAG